MLTCRADQNRSKWFCLKTQQARLQQTAFPLERFQVGVARTNVRKCQKMMLQRYVMFFSPSRQNAVPVLRFGWGTRTAWFGFGERRRGLVAKITDGDGSDFLWRNIWFGGHRNIWCNKKCVEIFSADLKNIHQCESFGSLVNNEVYREQIWTLMVSLLFLCHILESTFTLWGCVEAEVLLRTWRELNTRHVQTSAGDGLDESPDTWRPPLLRYIDI